MSRPQAFDALAAGYDDAFTNSRTGRYLREQIHARLDKCFRAGDHVLELGCGTGEDALYLGNRGVHVTATDVSDHMLEIARSKTQGNPFVSVAKLDLQRLNSGSLAEMIAARPLDGVFSNFGPLNCLDDWHPLAAWLAERVRPGGCVGLGIMSPFCLWEPLWHGLHLDFKTATRRWRKKTLFRPDDQTAPITISYPTIRRITRDFAPHFRRVHVQGIGVFFPPSDVFGAIEKRPRLFQFLMGLEQRFGYHSRLALLADHYWIELERG